MLSRLFDNDHQHVFQTPNYEKPMEMVQFSLKYWLIRGFYYLFNSNPIFVGLMSSTIHHLIIMKLILSTHDTTGSDYIYLDSCAPYH